MSKKVHIEEVQSEEELPTVEPTVEEEVVIGEPTEEPVEHPVDVDVPPVPAPKPMSFEENERANRAYEETVKWKEDEMLRNHAAGEAERDRYNHPTGKPVGYVHPPVEAGEEIEVPVVEEDEVEVK